MKMEPKLKDFVLNIVASALGNSAFISPWFKTHIFITIFKLAEQRS